MHLFSCPSRFHPAMVWVHLLKVPVKETKVLHVGGYIPRQMFEQRGQSSGEWIKALSPVGVAVEKWAVISLNVLCLFCHPPALVISNTSWSNRKYLERGSSPVGRSVPSGGGSIQVPEHTQKWEDTLWDSSLFLPCRFGGHQVCKDIKSSLQP